ncbi:hypothetical protein ScPMuIL_009398 [Solemya velum]
MGNIFFVVLLLGSVVGYEGSIHIGLPEYSECNPQSCSKKTDTPSVLGAPEFECIIRNKSDFKKYMKRKNLQLEDIKKRNKTISVGVLKRISVATSTLSHKNMKIDYNELNVSFFIPYEFFMEKENGVLLELIHLGPGDRDPTVYRLFDYGNYRSSTLDMNDPRVLTYPCYATEADGNYALDFTFLPFGHRMTYFISTPDKKVKPKSLPVAVALLPDAMLHVVFGTTEEQQNCNSYTVELIKDSVMNVVTTITLKHIKNISSQRFKLTTNGSYAVQIRPNADCAVECLSQFVEFSSEQEAVPVALNPPEVTLLSWISAGVGVIVGLVLIVIVMFIVKRNCKAVFSQLRSHVPSLKHSNLTDNNRRTQDWDPPSPLPSAANSTNDLVEQMKKYSDWNVQIPCTTLTSMDQAYNEEEEDLLRKNFSDLC